MESTLEYRDPQQRVELDVADGEVHLSCVLCGEPLGSYQSTTLSELVEVASNHPH